MNVADFPLTLQCCLQELSEGGPRRCESVRCHVVLRGGVGTYLHTIALLLYDSLQACQFSLHAATKLGQLVLQGGTVGSVPASSVSDRQTQLVCTRHMLARSHLLCNGCLKLCSVTLCLSCATPLHLDSIR